MLEFVTEKLPIKINGEVFELSYPTVGQLENYANKMKDGMSESEMVYSLLEECGLPSEKAKSLRPNQLNDLVVEISGSKK